MKQRYCVTLDINGYVSNIFQTGTINDFCELDLDEYDLSGYRKNAYKLGKNKLIFDEERYQQILAEKQYIADQKEIGVLQQKLNETDYIMAQWVEEIMSLENRLTWIIDAIAVSFKYMGKYRETIQNRKTWRERIRELRGE